MREKEFDQMRGVDAPIIQDLVEDFYESFENRKACAGMALAALMHTGVKIFIENKKPIDSWMRYCFEVFHVVKEQSTGEEGLDHT